MVNLADERKYRCLHDCERDGCPSHTMRVEVQTNADIMSVYLDGELYFCLDVKQWETLKEILSTFDYNQFEV